MYCETHVLLDDLAEAIAEGRRQELMESLAAVPLLVIDDFGLRKLPLTAAEDLLEIIMRRYERASTLLTSNRPAEDWGPDESMHRSDLGTKLSFNVWRARLVRGWPR